MNLCHPLSCLSAERPSRCLQRVDLQTFLLLPLCPREVVVMVHRMHTSINFRKLSLLFILSILFQLTNQPFSHRTLRRLSLYDIFVTSKNSHPTRTCSLPYLVMLANVYTKRGGGGGWQKLPHTTLLGPRLLVPIPSLVFHLIHISSPRDRVRRKHFIFSTLCFDIRQGSIIKNSFNIHDDRFKCLVGKM